MSKNSKIILSKQLQIKVQMTPPTKIKEIIARPLETIRISDSIQNANKNEKYGYQFSISSR